jgi:ABC-2 type transport system permease protein
MRRQVSTAVTMGLREFRRTPVLLALLVFLPVYIIGAFVYLVPDRPVPTTIDGDPVAVPMTDFAAAFMTPVTAAILAGIVGLFLIRSSQAADDRLRLAGYTAPELVVSRVCILGVGTVVVTAVSVLVATLSFTPESLAAFAVATLFVGLTYGILGVVVGIVFDQLAGVYVMLFAPMVDVLLFQNPLATESPEWTALLPSHYATNVLFDAAFTASVEAGDLFGAGGYVALLLVVGIAVFYGTTDVN